MPRKKAETIMSNGSFFDDIGRKKLGRVDLESKTLSMSYGEYVAAVKCGSIKRILADKGIDPDKVDELCIKFKVKRLRQIAEKKQLEGNK